MRGEIYVVSGIYPLNNIIIDEKEKMIVLWIYKIDEKEDYKKKNVDIYKILINYIYLEKNLISFEEEMT